MMPHLQVLSERKLNKDFERVDLSELDDDALSSLVQQEDDDLIFTIAENIIRDPEAHQYDPYDETTIRELPAPPYATFDGCKEIQESIQAGVKDAVEGYYVWLDDHRDTLGDEWEALTKVIEILSREDDTEC